ncbi:hypothetical protein [Enterobacillus tribolii]|uniref:Lipoprotein n=1 Tax=Enterobacillus tribolii TaxID=1487935 RepID=A0A370QPX3_9GAMM|nr:hypothetical protein [Enterobacillus tribolii]MBW7981461.1 hypothetical protein [Enterobacillus tribolii]RDK90838.1 hypothetical protein C8D90_105118 [Enterobacillus tribolii]
MKNTLGALFIMLTAWGCAAQPNEPSAPLPPVLIAIQAMGDSFQLEPSDVSIKQNIHYLDNGSEAVVEIEQTGIQDDSLAATKSIFTLNTADSGAWKVIKRVDTHKCHEGRGSQVYSVARCR